MGMSIVNNVASLNAQRALNTAGKGLQSSMSKLSSGSRITRAGDDAAGLAISEKLRAEIRGLNQASRNSNDAVSMIQTAEGAMGEVHNMLQRMRELAVQASNDTLDVSDRGFIDDELTELKNQINDIGDRTEFNGKTLLSGQLVSQLSSASGAVAGQVVDTSASTAITNVDVSGVRNAATTNKTFTFSANTGAGSITLTDVAASVSQTIVMGGNLAANSATTLDFSTHGIKISVATNAQATAAEVVTGLAASTNVVVAGATTAGQGAVNFATGPDEGDSLSVSFKNVKIGAAGTGAATAMSNLDGKLTAFTNAITANAGADQTAANDLIGELDAAIAYISENRSELGAFQNRLEYTINNLSQTAENLTAAESRIRDADVAEESASLAKQQVLQQAAVSVLAQANAQPQLALKLLA